MGLLPLASVQPESISSSFFMEIEVGHEVSAPSLFSLGATKANLVEVALLLQGCIPDVQGGVQLPEELVSRLYQPCYVFAGMREGVRTKNR